MSLSNAKHHAHLAKYSPTSDDEKLNNLVKAVYDLANAVEELEHRVQRVESKMRDR